MKKKISECKLCGKKRMIYSRGYCQHCYWQVRREEKAKEGKVRKQTSVYKPTGEKLIFDAVYRKQKGRCYITGQHIDYDRATPGNFVHILAKAQNKYPKFKLYDKNIVMTVFRFHQLYDHGTIEDIYKEFSCQRENVDKFFVLKEELIQEYKKAEGEL